MNPYNPYQQGYPPQEQAPNYYYQQPQYQLPPQQTQYQQYPPQYQQPQQQPQVPFSPYYGATQGQESVLPLGTFYIRCRMNGLVLDAKAEGKEKGTKVITWKFTGKPNQQWIFEADGVIRNVHNGLVLDIKGGTGPSVILWTYNGGDNQKWTYTKNRFHSLKNKSKVLDIKGENSSEGASLIVWDEKHTNSANQEFTIEPVPSTTSGSQQQSSAGGQFVKNVIVGTAEQLFHQHHGSSGSSNVAKAGAEAVLLQGTRAVLDKIIK